MRKTRRHAFFVLAVTGLATVLAIPGESPPAVASPPAACPTSNSAPTWNADTEKFEISTPEQLIHLSQNFDTTKPANEGVTGQWRVQSFVLKNDINLGGCNFTPIGDDGIDSMVDFPFGGTFDGAGHAIRGLVSEGAGARGLFATSTGATLTNLRLIDVSILSSNYDAGGLVGFPSSTTMSQVSVSGTVSGPRAVGGVAGSPQGGTKVRFSVSTVDVSVTGASTAWAGGLAGFISGSTASVDDSYARGSVGGTNAASFKGGLLGEVSVSATVDRTYSAAAVSGPGTLGGLVARTINAGSRSASFWDTEATGQTTSLGGSPKTTSEMQNIDTFTGSGANWKIVDGWVEFDEATAVWGICSGVNGGYPFLLWEYSTDPCVSQGSSNPVTSGQGEKIERAEVAAIHLDADLELGRNLTTVGILAEGQGLSANERYTLRLLPTNQLISQGTASRDGFFSATLVFPEALAAGTYTLQLATRSPSGDPLVLTTLFSINSEGILVAASSEEEPPAIEADSLSAPAETEEKPSEPAAADNQLAPEAQSSSIAGDDLAASAPGGTSSESLSRLAWIVIPATLGILAVAGWAVLAANRRRGLL